MDINIALSTIVYISIFLFPGILFRKFLFIGVDNKQFYTGHLFERFLWTIFFSFIVLFVSYLIFTISKSFFPLTEAISYDTIKEAFTTLSRNDFPLEEEFDDQYKNLIVLLFFIYLLSAALGYFTRVISSIGVIKSTGIFRRHNYWEDLIKGFRHNKSQKISDRLTYGYTKADVLIKLTDIETKLYSGIVKDYFICSDNNNLQEIVLVKTNRYSNKKPTTIPGDNFIIPSANILNMNFTYVYEKKDDNKLYSLVQKTIDVIYGIAIIGIIVYLFASDTLLPSVFNKTVFLIASIGIITVLKESLKHLLTKQFSKFKLQYVYRAIFNILPLLWIFEVISFLLLIVFEVLALVIIAALMTKKDVKE